MPIEEYWELEKELKEATYLLSTGASAPELKAAYKKVYVRAAAYAVHEKERTWLYDQ